MSWLPVTFRAVPLAFIEICIRKTKRIVFEKVNIEVAEKVDDAFGPRTVRADQYHTALGAPEPETQFETPNAVFSPPSSPRTFSFYSTLQRVELRLPFPSLDNGTLVDQQLTFLVVNPYSGKILEFRHHRPIQG
ncbi:hypothetical protein AVEN_119324-1 [Araneus ventricosus]|uniref:Uncharacterized protein n=1 Tax=Araneus ventricosus TaxID=182803 RepID=A0A4Y2QFM7_ARAVE|nr:hypothetical protein AVEN_119324-1 [Araneus ventricosus]